MMSWFRFIIFLLILKQCCGDLASMLSRVKDTNKSIQSMKSEHQSIKQKLDEIKEVALLVNEENQSAFDAYISPSSSFSLVADGTAIPYYQVALNAGFCNCTSLGQCYNPLFGFFQAPSNALYYFAVNFVSPADFVNNVYLRVASSSGINSVVNLKTYVAGSTTLQSGSHQVAVVLQLDAGSQVSVVSNNGGPGYVDVVPGTLSSFVGLQI